MRTENGEPIYLRNPGKPGHKRIGTTFYWTCKHDAGECVLRLDLFRGFSTSTLPSSRGEAAKVLRQGTY